MRTGATQESPTCSPIDTVTVDADVYTDRVTRAMADEQIWGGQYLIELDNSDEALNDKNYEGKPLTLNHAFLGNAGSDLAPLWVLTQEHISREGKLLLRLVCIDTWNLLSPITTTVTRQYWNYPWQTTDTTDEQYNEKTSDASQWDKTILDIVTFLAGLLSLTVHLDDDDGIINVQKPAFTVVNARTGIRQALEMTKLFPIIKSDGLHLIKPDNHATAYSYNTGNLFFSNVVDAGVTIPNKVTYWGRDASDNWISGSATDETSKTALGLADYIERHYFYTAPDEHGISTSVAALEALAAGSLTKIQGERSQGLLIAPMHCAQELLDKVEVVDSRYSTPKTTTGFVHRIIREYDRGVYRISLFLGGVTTGWTSPGGAPALPLAEKDTIARIPSNWRVPPGGQAYIANVEFTSVDYNTISWTSGNIRLQDGRTQAILAGSLDLTTTHYLYCIWGNNILQSSTTYSDAVGTGRMLVAVASKASTTAQKAYVLNPHTDSILINRDKVMDELVNELKLAPDAVRAQHIFAGAVTAIKIDVATLDAISANVGTLTAGVINGVTIYAGGGHVVLNASGIRITGQYLIFKDGANYGYIHQVGGILQILAGSGVAIQLASTTGIIINAQVRPYYNNSFDLGNSSYKWRYGYIRSLRSNWNYPESSNTGYVGSAAQYWYGGYFNILRYKNLGAFQHRDDIALIKRMKPDSKRPEFIDPVTFPKELLGEVSADEPGGGEPMLDLGKSLGLLFGAVRQIADRVDKLEGK